MPCDELLQISALNLAAAVHAGERSPLEVVDAHIARIEAVNGRLNAVVADRFEDARREARQAVSSVGAAVEKPLLGVPFTAKEMIAAAGMPLTFGCGNRRGRRATADATVIARLKAAGAILLGVTNIPEWGMWPESYNAVYGRTRNPYDPDRTPGGSSGGEGAIVGAGGAAFGIGSDVGGSVRMPAAFCGVVGHKPTTGSVPLTGHHPVYADGPDARLRRAAPYVTIGSLTRTVEDAVAVLRIIGGDDGIDPNVRRFRFSPDTEVAWRGRRVLLLADPQIRLASRPTSALRQCVLDAGRILESHGAVVEHAPPAMFLRAGDLWSAALQSVGGTAFAELLGAGEHVRLRREIVPALFGRARYSWPALLFLIAEVFGRRSRRTVERALVEQQRLGARFSEMLAGGGVLIMPTHPRPAPPHNALVLRPFDFLYTAALNALRVPATTVPMGFDGHGLPLAVQVAAREGEDHVTLAAAAAIEASMPAWRPAPAAAA